MRRRTHGDRAPLNAEINVVSLIDVMMLLLVIFMMTAPLMQGGVDVRLPKTEARSLEPKGGLVVSVAANGRVYADETGMSLSEFKAAFKMLSSNRGRDGVFVRADQGAPYGIVAQVLATIQKAGIVNVGLVTEPESVQP
ncbi:MAG: biopolymer transporter ExbD [Gemmatimonadetes bacterium]|nr:biopolymer transporter ExbD [Gemmatimonadota bacterium]